MISKAGLLVTECTQICPSDQKNIMEAFHKFLRKMSIAGPGKGRSMVPRREKARKSNRPGYSRANLNRGKKTMRETRTSTSRPETAGKRLPFDRGCNR